MKETISGKYLAILAIAAAGILFVGGRFRPRQVETAPSPTETATLQQNVRRDQAAGIGQYLASRAAELADQVVLLPSRGTSGVRYESSTKVLTVDGSGQLIEPVLTIAEISSNVKPAPPLTSQRNQDGWILILGRSSNDQPLWTAVIQGVKETAVCNDVTYQELAVNVTLEKSFAGAGAFDLDGNLVGIAMPCDGALHIVSIGSVPDLLAKSTAPERVFIQKFGFQAAPLPPGWGDMYPRLNGLIVTEVWLGQWADRSGLLPGDLIITDDPTLHETTVGATLKTARPGRPGITQVKVDLSGNDTGIAVLPAPSPLLELRIAHGTAAERAGLRSGDHLVSILGQRSSSISTLSKMLATPNKDPIRIVYERGKRRGVVEVPRAGAPEVPHE
ncbi:MAG: PDZ domain-containing protein, partial [Bryobacteraceae bacterium]